ncbi:MAG: TPM domain-containing protein, partial [Neisseriaceae bacterium]|nr:TPM domain-containing protein [Neisseriaceae bacterium]
IRPDIRELQASHLSIQGDLQSPYLDVAADPIVERMTRPQIEKLIAGEKLPENTHQNNNQDSYLGLLLICFIFAGAFLRLALGDKVGSLATGGVLSVVSLLLGFGILTALFFGIIAAIASFLFGSGAFVSHSGYGGGSWGNGGGFGGGGFGGGGFGGGGGSFGGGGASGGW